MRAQDIEMQQFKSIDDLYLFLEENANALERNWDITDLLVKYLNQTVSDEEKEYLRHEIGFFSFEITGANAFPIVNSISENGKQIEEYPSLNKEQRDKIDYLIKRANSSKNSVLLARYNHLLWIGPKGIKNKKYASLAIQNYAQSIRNYYDSYQKDKNQESALTLTRLYERAVKVSEEAKSEVETLKKLTNFLLFDADNLEFYSKHSIINDMLSCPKIYKGDDFQSILPIFKNKLKDQKFKNDNFQLVNYYLPTALQVAQRLNTDVNEWHNEIGLAHLRMGDKETQQERYWLKLDSYAKAISSFVTAGKKANKKKAEKLYSELKPKVTLPVAHIDFNEETDKKLKEFQDFIRDTAKDILKEDPAKVYSIIASGFFFPKYADIKKAATGTKNDFLNFATTILFDKNKNVTKSSKDDVRLGALFDPYSYQISLSVLPYLHNILITGIKSGHLTFENLIVHLRNNTWIGKSFIKKDLGGADKEVQWIPLLVPSIVDFFSQVRASHASKFYNPNFILCIDSLTLKLEGLLRNFAERLSVPVSVSKKGAMQEVNLNNVLDNATIMKFFNEDDRLFFDYLFTYNSGINLRNNVAHCFYNYDEYTYDKMLLLIAALLRIGKYDYNPKKK